MASDRRGSRRMQDATRPPAERRRRTLSSSSGLARCCHLCQQIIRRLRSTTEPYEALAHGVPPIRARRAAVEWIPPKLVASRTVPDDRETIAQLHFSRDRILWGVPREPEYPNPQRCEVRNGLGTRRSPLVRAARARYPRTFPLGLIPLNSFLDNPTIPAVIARGKCNSATPGLRRK